MYSPSAIADTEARCPACGNIIDYCQGHGSLGDPWGFAILAKHDDDNHEDCHPDGCDELLYAAPLTTAALHVAHGGFIVTHTEAMTFTTRAYYDMERRNPTDPADNALDVDYSSTRRDGERSSDTVTCLCGEDLTDSILLD